MADSKPRVLVLGGVGFVGRNLVRYLAENNLCSKIAVADKVLPDTAGLSAAELKVFKNESLVVYKQANLAREAMVAKAFELDGGNFKYVFNLAAITKYSQPEEVYKENVIDVAKVCAAAAVKYKAARFIHVSTAQVYAAGKKQSAEDDKIKPWTGVAKASLEGEKIVQSTAGLNYVIVRPAIIYGPGDQISLTPRLIIVAVYKKTQEKMEMLWTKELRINTVHVRDVCKALWLLTTSGNSGQIFNLADQNDTDQGKMNELMEEIYGIKTGFMGQIKSGIASKMSMKMVTEIANDKHLKPWSDLTKENGIQDTPLTPYLDEELLLDHSLAIDGTFITKLGFVYDHPKPTSALLKEVLKDFVEKKYYPKGIITL